MEDALENLRLLDDEEEALQEHDGALVCVHQLCLVGRCLTDSVVHFLSLRNTMADLWHPIGGICITEIGEKRYLFQFFHEVDIVRVVVGIPWFFNNHLIILQRVPIGVNPVVMELNHTEFWLQVHDLPPGLMSVSMAKQFGDFCGKFLEYDTSIPTLGIQNYLRIRVCLNVAAPLKRKKKVLIGKSMVVYARFKYEKLSLFCFICGKLGHGESYCPLRLSIDPSKIVFGWDLSIRAVARNRSRVASRWLRAADGSPSNDENWAGFTQGNLGSVHSRGVDNLNKGSDGCIDAVNSVEVACGPMELVSMEENVSIMLTDGKKRQRTVENSCVLVDANVGAGSMDVSASSAGQSSRAQ